MVTRTLCLLWTLAVLPAVRADFSLDPGDFVPNPDGYCAWDCVEMAGRHLGVARLRGLVDRARAASPDGGAGVNDLAAELKHLGVRCRVQYTGNRATGLLAEAVAAGRGAVVALKDYPAAGDSHAVYLTGWQRNRVAFVDPNRGPDPVVRSRAWFLQRWRGYAVVVVPDEPPPPAVSPPPRPRPLPPPPRCDWAAYGFKGGKP